jgi:hypothetical protein
MVYVAGTIVPSHATHSQELFTRMYSAMQSLAGTMGMVEADPDASKAMEVLQSRANGVAATNMPAAFWLLEQQNQNVSIRAMSILLIRRWAGNDARSAAQWVEQMPAGRARQEALRGVAIVWANKELDNAIQWVRQWPEEEERQSVLKSVAYEAARTEPEKALDLAAVDIEPTLPGRDELVRYAAMQWASKDPESALTWGLQISDGALREQVMACIATALAETDPVAASTLALAAVSTGRLQDDAVMGIVQRWVQKEPEMTAAWVEQFPDGSLKQTALENVVKLWADRDAEQVAEWLNNLSSGWTRDTAVAAFAGWLTPASPETAARWAESVKQGDAR